MRRDYLAWARSGDEQRGVDEEIPMHERYGIGEHKDMLAEPGKSTGGSSSPSGEQQQEEKGCGARGIGMRSKRRMRRK